MYHRSFVRVLMPYSQKAKKKLLKLLKKSRIEISLIIVYIFLFCKYLVVYYKLRIIYGYYNIISAQKVFFFSMVKFSGFTVMYNVSD